MQKFIHKFLAAVDFNQNRRSKLFYCRKHSGAIYYQSLHLVATFEAPKHNANLGIIFPKVIRTNILNVTSIKFNN